MSWYVAGTVSVTEGNNLVSGTGTDFVNNVRAGDSFQGPDGRQYQITNVISALQISILPAYQSESLSDQSYAIIPSFAWAKEAVDKLSQVVDQFGTLAANTNNKWVSASTPTAALEALGTFINLVTAENAEAARNVLELGAAATRAVGTSTGNVMQVGAGGLLSLSSLQALADDAAVRSFCRASGTQFFRNDYTTMHTFSYGQNLLVHNFDTFAFVAFPYSGSIPAKITVGNSNIYTVHTLLGDKNTTVDTNGFIKAASPVLRLFNDRVDANAEAELQSVQFERIGIGHYTITNTQGLADEGWYIETPRDANGLQKRYVEYSQAQAVDGTWTLTVLTFAPDYSAGVLSAGDPMDLDERWIDVRLNSLPEPDAESEPAPTE